MSETIREALRVAMSFAEQSTDSRTAIAHIRGLCSLLDSALAQQSDPVVPTGWTVLRAAGGAVRPTDRWEVYSPEGSGGVVRSDEIANQDVSRLLDALVAAPVVQEPATWVSVADRLPSEDSEVIVSGWAYNDPARGRFVTHADFSDGQFKPVGAADEYDLHPPTHWMPMPSAPGEAAPPAAEQLAQSAPDELRARCDGGTCGLGEVCENCMMADAIELAAEPDTVAVPRELLDSAARSCANGWIDYQAAQELRALLAGGAE